MRKGNGVASPVPQRELRSAANVESAPLADW
jgi:hypothetical protein